MAVLLPFPVCSGIPFVLFLFLMAIGAAAA